MWSAVVNLSSSSRVSCTFCATILREQGLIMWSAVADWSHDPMAMASSSELLGGKRNRRPSVRLGEIGDLPAAVLSESSNKHRKLNAVSMPVQTASAVSGCTVSYANCIDIMDSVAMRQKLCEPQPSDSVNAFLSQQILSSDIEDVPRCSSPLPHADVRPCSTGPSPQQLIKRANKKARNRNRKAGGPKGLTDTVSKLVPSTAQLSPSLTRIDGRNSRSVSLTNDVEIHPGNVAFDADTPEGLRDSDFETSDCTKEVKDVSKSHESPHPYSSSRSPSDYQQDYQSLQSPQEYVIKQDQDFRDRMQDKGASASNQVGLASDGREMPDHSSEAEVKPQAAAKSGLRQVKVKNVEEVNASLECRDDIKEDTGQKFDQGPALPLACQSIENGVIGWLEALGLGKYTSLFDTHEVDTEVLPLLTSEDLKEMGILAVGTRRKMLYAIKQLGRGQSGA